MNIAAEVMQTHAEKYHIPMMELEKVNRNDPVEEFLLSSKCHEMKEVAALVDIEQNQIGAEMIQHDAVDEFAVNQDNCKGSIINSENQIGTYILHSPDNQITLSLETYKMKSKTIWSTGLDTQ